MSESKTFKREVEIIVTPQAQKVLEATSYSVEDFLDWALEHQKISFGGHNVVVFLESK